MPQTLAEDAKKLNFSARPLGTVAIPYAWAFSDPRADVRRAIGRLPRGGAVVFRHYDDPARLRLAKELVRLCRNRGVRLLIAGDWRLAEAVGADGVHLPEGLARHGVLAPILRWHRAKPGRLLTIATHSERALVQAGVLRADVVFLSPVFPTASHPGAPTLGAARFADLVRKARCPVVALGGINTQTIRRLRGAWGVAAISGWE